LQLQVLSKADHLNKLNPLCRMQAHNRSLLLVRRSETHYPKTCGIWSVLWTVTDSHWRLFLFSQY